MITLLSDADLKSSYCSRIRGFVLSCMIQILVLALSIAIAGSNALSEAKQEAVFKDYELRQEGVWKDYKKPFEEDILVSQSATIRVNLPERFFKVEKVTLSVTTDATPNSEPKITIGEWEKDLGDLLTPREYFTTLLLTETISLEIPTRHFQRGGNEIKFYSVTNSPEDQYIVTKLEFAMVREEVRATPPVKAPGKVRIGLLTNLGEKFYSKLRDEVEKRPNWELIKIPESIHCSNVNLETGELLNRKYKVDILICTTYIYHYHLTKLIDISGQRLLQLDPIRLDRSHGILAGWEKKLVSEQIGPIEKMADEISQQKMLPKKPEGRLEVTLQAPAELKKVRIGVLTELQKNLERDYFNGLKEVLAKREDSELVLLLGPITYDPPYTEAIKSLRQKYQIDMIIYIGTKVYSTGDLYWTGLVDASKQKFVDIPTVYIPQENRYRWEKILLKKQLEPIEKMIDEISQEKAKPKS